MKSRYALFLFFVSVGDAIPGWRLRCLQHLQTMRVRLFTQLRIQNLEQSRHTHPRFTKHCLHALRPTQLGATRCVEPGAVCETWSDRAKCLTRNSLSTEDEARALDIKSGSMSNTFGVDLTLVDATLAMNVEQRLRQNDRMSQLTARLQEAFALRPQSR